MSLHPSIKRMLDSAAGATPMHTLNVDTIRATDLSRYAAVPRADVARVEDRTIEGPRGDIRIRIYRPSREEGLPVIIFFHGSGFCICSIDTHDGMCRQICLRTRANVVSVGYRLAPEHKFPAGVDDSLAATRWVIEHATEIGADPARIALAGDSAGGTMATVTAMRLRDEGDAAIAAQLLMYPVTDHPSAGTPSYMARGSGYGLTKEIMHWFWGHYLGDSAAADHPHASPNRAADLSRLPPAYIVTAEYDPLRDEGESYADRLRDHGVVVTRVRYGDVNHGFMSWTGLIDRSDEAMDAACAWLRARLIGR